jgi:hypothetical protein
MEIWQALPSHGAEWESVVAEVLLAVVCVRASSVAGRVYASQEAVFWKSAALILTAIATVELFDLQAYMTGGARAIATAAGWYETRRPVQIAVVCAVISVSAVAGCAALWLARARHPCVLLAIIGLGLIVVFGLLRIVSLHEIDAFLDGHRAAPDRASVVKAFALGMIALSAILYAPRRSSSGAIRQGRG